MGSNENGTLVEPLLPSTSATAAGEAATDQKERGGGTDHVATLEMTPLKKAGFLSVLTFTWMQPLIRLGNSKTLHLEDVPLIPPEDSAAAALLSFNRVYPESSSVFRALVRCFWWDILRTGMLAFLRATATLCGPVFLYLFVDYASGNEHIPHEAIILMVSLVAVKLIENISQRHWYFGVRRLGLKMQSAAMAAIYEKELTLSSAGRRRHAIGEVANYVSVDAYRLSEFVWWFHWGWIVPYQIAVAAGLLFAIVGWAALPGLILILMFILVITPLIMSMQKSQGLFMVAQDERLRATTEVLNGIKVIKLQAWEEKFKAFIEGLRGKEFESLGGTQGKRNYATVLYWLMPTVITAVVLITCIFIGTTLTATVVFTVLATFRIIQDPIRTIPDVLSALIQAQVSFKRLHVFLQEEDLPLNAIHRGASSRVNQYAIRVDSATFSWNPQELKPSIKNINMVVSRGEKVAVCGAIGSGKSSLLSAILGEIPKLSGSVHLSGRVAYVAQTAWIQTGSVRDNILFGMPMNELRYQSTLRACALEQDIQNFSHGDLTEIGERGINMSGGQKQRIQLARAVYNDADIYFLDDPFSAVDAQTAATLFHDCVLGALKEKTVVLVTHQVEFLPAVDTIMVMQDGEIIQQGTYDQLFSSANVFQKLVMAHKEVLNGVRNDEDADSNNSGERSLQKRHSKEEIQEQPHGSLNADIPSLIQEEETEVGDMGLKPYLEYIQIARGTPLAVLAIIGQIAYAVTQLTSNIWLAVEINSSTISSSVLVGVYTGLSLMCIIFFFIRSKLTVALGLRASKAFFNGLMNSVMRAPMSFFDSTPSGRLLNRASVDMSIVDLDIPSGYASVLALAFDLAGIVIVMGITTWKILLVSIPMLLLVLYMQRFYLKASQELSRANAVTKAPILNNSAETISGAVTIRAFQMVEQFKRKNLQLIDSDARVYFHKHAALEWLIFRIELSCSVVVCAIALFVVLQQGTGITPGFAGLAITYALALNNCQIFFSWWQCMLANLIVSVERIKQYMNIPAEAPPVIESNRPPANWPTKGKIVLEQLQIRYRENSPLVLKGISCTFEGGRRVGVVGRTGSGKTTLISALFRLVEPAGGRILIDGIDICAIGLHDLRFRLGIIPQEPVLFRGTVRTNLDPLNQYTDFEIWETLEKCQLGRQIRSLPHQLESPVTDQGENWSAGQRQLFCLGRVLLKRSQVLVLDEATASIDSTTDALLQKVIREEFCACTVITVAHRIPTVIDSDMVLALRNGRLVEYESPSKLMENKSSLFAKLVAEYWAQATRKSA